MNFQAIQQAVYRRTKLSDTPSVTDATRIKQFINLWYRELLATPGMDRFRDATIPFTTTASQKQFGIPQAISRVRDIFDVTNQRKLTPKTVDWLRSVDPGLTATAALVEFWIPLNGWGATLNTLTTTGVPLYAVSDSASDTTQNVFVETTRLGGVRAGTAVSAGTTLTGTTRVQLGTKSDHIEVVKFYSHIAPIGTISLYDAASSGNLLSQITPGRTQARYFMLQLYPTISSAIAISVDCQRAIEDLVNDMEEPLLHEDYHHVLVHGAAYEEWLNRDDDRAQKEYARAMKIVSDLRISTQTNPDEIAVQRGPRGNPERVSRLGGYYPAGT